MKVTKYEAPIGTIDALFDRLNRGLPVLDRFFSENNGNGEWTAARLPRTNVRETDDAFILTMEMPGLKREDITVNLEGDTLIVKGEHSEKSEEEGVIRREFRSTRFERSFNIGGVDREKVRAKMENGILSVTLPKTPEKVGKKIDVA